MAVYVLLFKRKYSIIFNDLMDHDDVNYDGFCISVSV